MISRWNHVTYPKEAAADGIDAAIMRQGHDRLIPIAMITLEDQAKYDNRAN